MAKKLLLGILSDLLGTYVDGFNGDNLEIGILSGKLELKNLKLRTDALDNLPIQVSHGSINRISVDVPWAHLESRPVKIAIDGVFLQLGPINVHSKTQKDMKKLALLSRRSQLDKAEQMALKTFDLSKEDVNVKVDKIAWSQQVAVKIADNIELHITNIHIRYEDSISIPGQCYSLGFTLALIKLCSTDGNWKEAFVDRSDSKAASKDVHKLGSIENAGFYWNSSDTPIESLSADAWEETMERLIYKNSSGTTSATSAGGNLAGKGIKGAPNLVPATSFTDSLQYILKPTNLFTLKLTHREVSTATIPKIDALVESNEIPFQLTSEQFRQVQFTLRVMGQIEKQKQMSLYKPASRPTESAKEWWKYAFKMVTGKGVTATSGSKFDTMLKCIRNRKRYIDLIKTGLLNKELAELNKSKAKKEDKKPDLKDLIPGIHILTEAENDELFVLESILPMHALTAFRQIAANEYLKEKCNRLLEKEQREKEEKKSIFSFGKSKDKDFSSETSSSHGNRDIENPSLSPDSGKTPEKGEKKSFFSSKFSSIFGEGNKKKKEKDNEARAASSETDELSVSNVNCIGNDSVAGSGNNSVQGDNVSVSATSDMYSDDDDIMEKLRQQLVIAESSVAANEAYPIRIIIVSSCRGEIKKTENEPILGLQLAIAAQIEFKEAQLLAKFCVNEFTASDRFTVNPIEKYILRALHPTNINPFSTGSLNNESDLKLMKVDFSVFPGSGRSKVSVAALPLQIVVNGPCIKALFNMFVNSEVDALSENISMYSNKKLLQIMQKYSDQGDVPVFGSIDFEINIDAPKIVIVQTPDRDENGCLVLDCGSLQVNGNMSPLGILINLGLNQVYMSLPRTLRSRSNFDHSDPNNYLISPFDVTVRLQSQDKSQSNLSINTLIAHPITITSDIQKLIRLTKIGNVLFDIVANKVEKHLPELMEKHSSAAASSVNNAALKARRKSSDNQLSRTVSRISSDGDSSSAGGANAMMSKLSKKLQGQMALNPHEVKFSFNLKLSSINLRIIASDIPNHYLEIVVSNFNADMKIRHYDQSAKLTLSSLSIVDSLRCDSHKCILTSSHIDNTFVASETSSTSEAFSPDECLIAIEACKITNRNMSTLYNQYETELKLNLSTIKMAIDAGAILRLETLLVGIKKLITEQVVQQQINVALKIRQSKAIFEKSFNELSQKASSSVKITLKMQSISLEILHTLNLATPKAKLADIGLELESAFELKLRDLYVCIDKSDLTQLIQGQMSLDSISIEDRRNASASFVYRKIFEKNSLGSQFSSSNPYNIKRSLSVTDADDLEKLLLIKYEQKSVEPDAKAACVIEVKSTSTIVNVDSILSLLGVLLQVADAGKTIASSLNVPELQLISPELAQEMIIELEAQGISTVNKVLGSHFDLTLLVSNTRLILLEDPSSVNTRAIVSKCGILVQHTHDSSKVDEENSESEMETREKLRISLQKAEVFVLSGMVVGNPEQLMEPLSYDINYNFSSLKKCHNIAMALDDITLKVSYNDILLVTALAAKASDILSFNKSVQEEQQRGNQEGGNASSPHSSSSSQIPNTSHSPLPSISFDFVLSFSCINVMLIDDYGSHRLPLLRLKVSNKHHGGIRIEGRNSLFSREDASVIINLDYYNSRPAVWEPIIETWSPDLSIESINELQQGSYIRLTSIETLQLNISGQLIRNLHKFLNILQKSQIVSKKKKRLEDFWKTNKITSKAEESIDNIENRSIIANEIENDSGIRTNYPLVFVNELGLNVSVYVYRSRYLLCEMEGIEVTRAQISDINLLDAAQENSPKRSDSSFSSLDRRDRTADIPIPPSFHLSIQGDEHVSDTKLSQLPLLSSKPKLYHVNRMDNDKLNPYFMFWDVKLLDNGTRAIFLRSGFKLENLMPFPIEIMVSFADYKRRDPVVLGPILERASFHLPVNVSDAILLQFRPLAMKDSDTFKLPFKWSNAIDCTPIESKTPGSSKNKKSTFIDILCEVDPSELASEAGGGVDNRTGGPSYQAPVYVRLAVEKSNHRIKVVMLPFAIIKNLLPCRFLFKCKSDDRSIQNGVLAPGQSVQLHHVCPSSNPQLCIQTGAYIMSQMRPITRSNKMVQFSMDLVSPNDSNGGISLTMTSILKPNGIVEVKIYSSYVLMDRTGLNLAIKSRRFKSGDTSFSEGNSNFEIQDVLERRTFEPNLEIQHVDPGSCWSDGGGGVVLFQSTDETATIAVCTKLEGNAGMSAIWSDPLSLLSINSSKVPLELVDKAKEKSYLLSYSLSPMLDIFSATRALKFMPWYGIVNCTDELIEVYQADNLKREITGISAKSTVGWHKSSSKCGTSLRIRTESSMWSLGILNINDIGSASLVLPMCDSNNAKEAIILRIEVKFAEKDEDCLMSVVIWREKIISSNFQNISVAIQNTSNFPICVCQDLSSYVKKHNDFTTADALQYELCVPPNAWAPFGWADMAEPLSLVAAVSTSLKFVKDGPDKITLDVTKHNDKKTLLIGGEETNGQSAHVHVIEFEIQTRGGGYVIFIRQLDAISQKETQDQLSKVSCAANEEAKAAKRFVEFSLFLRSLNVSIIAESPVRREFFSLYVEGLELNSSVLVNLNSSMDTTSFHQRNTMELKILNMQLDNYSESVLHPVMMHTYDEQARTEHERERRIKQGDKSEDIEPLNFLQFMVVKEFPNNSTFPIYKYVALRALEIQCAIDSSTIQIFLLDLLPDLTGQSTYERENFNTVEYEQQFVDDVLTNATRLNERKEDMRRWCAAYIEDLGKFNASPLIDIHMAMQLAQSHRMYFESIAIHPFKVRVTFSVSDFPRSESVDIFQTYPWLKVTRGLAGIEDILLTINSFIVDNVFETSQTLLSRLQHKTTNEMKYQAAKVAGKVMGSLNLIGRPVGLLSKIGNGVTDVFYEPFKGAMVSPKEFVFGLGKGTGSLVSNVVKGTLTSATSIINSATNTIALGASTLTFDKEFEKQREEKRREVKAAGGGFVSGLKAGGESFVTGFTSGITGLVTKPIQGAKKGGVIGFGKGIVQGVIGVPTKLVIGITEGLANVAQGATNEMSDILVVSNARYPRAFRRSVIAHNERILVDLDLSAAKAQFYVKQLTKSYESTDKASKDEFHSFVNLGFNVAVNQVKSDRVVAVAISNFYIFLLSQDVEEIKKIPFSDISHCEYQPLNQAIRLITYQVSQSSSGGGFFGLGGKTSETSGGISINCHSEKECIVLYDLLMTLADKMGNPSMCLPFVGDPHETRSDDLSLSDISAGGSETASHGPFNPSQAAITELKQAIAIYKFGALNDLEFKSISLGSGDVIFARAKDRFEKLSIALAAAGRSFFLEFLMKDFVIPASQSNAVTYLQLLELLALQLSFEWKSNHTYLNRRKCCCLLLINSSTVPIQVKSVDLRQGSEVFLLSTKTIDKRSSYMADTRVVVEDGGAVIIFGTANRMAEVQIRVATTAGNIAVVSSGVIGNDCQGSGGRNLGFAEKTIAETWAKFVVVCS